METLTVKAERMAPEGSAITRPEGATRIVFVPYGVPGDRLEVETFAAKSTFAKGRIKKLLEAGPERITPPCALHFDPSRPGPACGGCDWQQLGYAAQLRHKREVVMDCLVRIGKLKGVEVSDTVASPKVWGYRNKVQIPFAPPPSGSRRPVAGFYETGSHRIVDFKECAVQPDLSVRIALKVKELAEKFRWPIYEEDKSLGWLRHLYIRTNSEGKALVALVTRTPEFPRGDDYIKEMTSTFPEVVGLWQNLQALKTSVILGLDWRRLWGARGIEEKIGPYSFFCSPGAFMQVNTEAAALLYDAALAALTEGGKTFASAVDLYCGVGTLSVWIAKKFKRVTGVEENREAVRDAYKNAQRNGIKNLRFMAGRAEAVLPRLLAGETGPCAALVDPPRAGCGVPVLRWLTRPVFKRVVYVSCDPATFARDAGYLTHSGYRLVRVQPFDLFPQTSHVEVVGLFTRP